MTSNALVPSAKGTPRCPEDGTLIRYSGGPGLTMAQIIDQGGKIVTRVCNTGYDGPLKHESYIQAFFSEAGPEKRERALDKLYKADRDNLTKEHHQLLDHCHDLLKYALPEYVILQSISIRRVLTLVIQIHSKDAAHYLQDSNSSNHTLSWDQASVPSPKDLQKGITASWGTRS